MAQKKIILNLSWYLQITFFIFLNLKVGQSVLYIRTKY